MGFCFMLRLWKDIARSIMGILTLRWEQRFTVLEKDLDLSLATAGRAEWITAYSKCAGSLFVYL